MKIAFCNNNIGGFYSFRKDVVEHFERKGYELILLYPACEDNGLMMRVFYYSNKVCSIHSSFYHYNRANIVAMTSGYGRRQVDQMIKVAQELTNFF